MRKQYDLDKHINIGEKSVLIVDVHFTRLSTHEKKNIKQDVKLLNKRI